MMRKGMLVILSAPSGCGKDTVFKEICKRRNDVVESVSATTRQPREGEQDGVNYFFVTEDEFKSMIENRLLLEHACYNNYYYGTPVKGVYDAIRQGKICFLIIEVHGALAIKNIFPDCVSIFLLPPSLDELEKRLRRRESDGEDIILSRLNIARDEIMYSDNYDYRVVNDDLSKCVSDIDLILTAELKKRQQN